MEPESFSSLLVIVIGRTGQEENRFVKETNIHGYITCHYGKTWGILPCISVPLIVENELSSFDSVYYLYHTLPL